MNLIKIKLHFPNTFVCMYACIYVHMFLFVYVMRYEWVLPYEYEFIAQQCLFVGLIKLCIVVTSAHPDRHSVKCIDKLSFSCRKTKKGLRWIVDKLHFEMFKGFCNNLSFGAILIPSILPAGSERLWRWGMFWFDKLKLKI